MKLNLTGSDYAPYIQNIASPIFTSMFLECCTKKLVEDWNKMRCEVNREKRMGLWVSLMSTLCHAG